MQESAADRLSTSISLQIRKEEALKMLTRGQLWESGFIRKMKEIALGWPFLRIMIRY